MDLDNKADLKSLQKLEDTLGYEYMNSESIEKIKRELEHNMDTLTSRLEGAAPAREVSNLGNKMEKMFQKQSEKLATIRDCQRDKNELQKQIDKLGNE
jgi:hypothetical protein